MNLRSGNRALINHGAFLFLCSASSPPVIRGNNLRLCYGAEADTVRFPGGHLEILFPGAPGNDTLAPVGLKPNSAVPSRALGRCPQPLASLGLGSSYVPTPPPLAPAIWPQLLNS